MRGKKKGFSDQELVTSKKSTANGLFWCLTLPMEAIDIKYARPALDLSCLSGTDISVVPAWQLSEDGDTWPTTTTTPGTFAGGTIGVTSTETTTFSTAGVFEDISASMTKKYVRFGVWVKNLATGTTVEMALAAIRLEFKKC